MTGSERLAKYICTRRDPDTRTWDMLLLVKSKACGGNLASSFFFNSLSTLCLLGVKGTGGTRPNNLVLYPTHLVFKMGSPQSVVELFLGAFSGSCPVPGDFNVLIKVIQHIVYLVTK